MQISSHLVLNLLLTKVSPSMPRRLQSQRFVYNIVYLRAFLCVGSLLYADLMVSDFTLAVFYVFLFAERSLRLDHRCQGCHWPVVVP